MKNVFLTSGIIIMSLCAKSQITSAKNGLSLEPNNSKVVEFGGSAINPTQINAAKLLSNRELFMNRFNLAFTDGGSSHHLSNAIQIGGASYSTPGGKLDIRNNNFHNGLLLSTNQDTAIAVHGIYVTNCVGSTIANYGIESNVSGAGVPENIGIKTSSSNSAINRSGYFVANAGSNSASLNYGTYGTGNGGTKSYGGYFKGSGASANNYGIYSEVIPFTGSVSWAGYFVGDVNISGAAYCSSGLWTGSDKRFKHNIKKLENVSEKLNKINAYTYELNSQEFQNKNFDISQQIGLIAQEVAEVFPQLVKEDKTGFLAVNYQAMVPVLLEAIKEQQKSIEDLRSEIVGLKNSRSEITNSDRKSVVLSDKNIIVLGQNTPNPFAESTIITFRIPQKFNKAQIVFNTMDGKMLNVHEIKDANESSLNVFANDLSTGFYTYSLVIDGKIIETKSMIKE